MASLISKLGKKKRKELLQDLNYLNVEEIKSFCRKHSIPYMISYETKAGKRQRTSDMDRKGVILRRVRHFLKTGSVLQETCFPAAVVCFDALPEHLSSTNKLFYGQYDKSNQAVATVLRNLTGGRFTNGAIARILAREYWSQGKAPTFREYAHAWLKAWEQHTKPNPEWAFLSDRANKIAGTNWKTTRANKVSRVLKVLADI